MSTNAHHPVIVGTVEDARPSMALATANPFERMAFAMVSGGGDLSNLERLLSLQREWEADQARKSYALDMAACQAEMPCIFKDRYNEQTKSWYATLESTNKRITPIYTAHGFSLSFNTDDSPFKDCIRVVCRVIHKLGHVETFHYDQPIDDAGIAGTKNKTQTHGRGSAMSYARRYLTFMIFNLATSDDNDGNTATTEKVERQKKPETQGKPTSGAWEAQSEESQAFLLKIARTAMQTIEESPADTLDYIKSQQLDADETIALWTRFDSKTRSALKKADEAKKKESSK